MGGEELEDDRGDDPERSFGTKEEVFQIVTSVVLAEPSQTVPDRSVRQDDFEPEYEVSRVTISKDRNTARIGRKVTANLTAAFGTETEREQSVRFFRGILDRRKDAAGFRRQCVVEGIDLPIWFIRESDSTTCSPVSSGVPPPQYPGVAALRRDRDAGVRTDADDSGDFTCRGRTQHNRRAAMVELSCVDGIAFRIDRDRPNNRRDRARPLGVLGFRA